MAYADSNEMTNGRLVSIILVVGLHIFLGYALITGLAYEAVEKAVSTITAVEVEEEIPDEEEPPPPEPEVVEIVPPPVFVPPPPVVPPQQTPQITTVDVRPPPPPITLDAGPPPPPATKSCGGGISVLATEACPPPPPPPKVSTRPNPVPRGNPSRWANANDYPSRALREEREGTTRFSVTVNAKGRVDECIVTGSSGHTDLDDATCRNIKRRARFRPALDPDGNEIAGRWSNRVRWQIPQ